MSVHVLVHLLNEEPFQADMDELPSSTSSHIYLKNLRTREGKPVTWNSKGTIGMLFPWTRVLYIEVMVQGQEQIEKFYRDSTKV